MRNVIFALGLALLATAAQAATVKGWVSYNQYGDTLVDGIALSSAEEAAEDATLLVNWLEERRGLRTYVVATGEVVQGFESDVLLTDRYWVFLQGRVGENQYGDVTLTVGRQTYFLTNASELTRYRGRRVSVWVGDFKQGFEGLYLTYKGRAN